MKTLNVIGICWSNAMHQEALVASNKRQQFTSEVKIIRKLIMPFMYKARFMSAI